MVKIPTGIVKNLPDFRKFSKFIFSNQEKITPNFFATELRSIKNDYMLANERQLFCQRADRLAEQLESVQNRNFAGIVYSLLAKITEPFPKELEYYAYKGYKAAQRNNDPIHMLARLNDIRRLIYCQPARLHDYVNILFEQERCLKTITSSYDKVVGQFHTISRPQAPRKDYETMLAYIQTELSKLIWKKEPDLALKKLKSAQDIFRRTGEKGNREYITLLMCRIKAQPRFENFA